MKLSSMDLELSSRTPWEGLERLCEGLASFLPIRCFLSILPLFYVFDVATDILAVIEFANPFDDKPIQKWWTGLSVLCLLLSFRAGFVRWWRRTVSLTLSEIMVDITPFYLPAYNWYFSVENTDLWKGLIREVYFIVISPAFPLLLLFWVQILIRRSWWQTGRGLGLPHEASELGIFEAIESVSQLSIQTRAYTRGYIRQNTYWISMFFSLFGIIKATTNYWMKYQAFKQGMIWCIREFQWADKDMKILPFDIRGDCFVVREITLDKNPLKLVKWWGWDNFIKKFPRLKNLHLAECSLGWSGVKALSWHLARNSCIAKIDLRHNDIGFAGCIHLAFAVNTRRTLLSINLACNSIGNDGTIELTSALLFLEHLDLHNNGIGDLGAQALGSGLTKGAVLKSLRISSNEIWIEGAEGLARGLLFSKTLLHLDLRNNYIQDEGAMALARSLKDNTTLKSLNISANGISFDGVNALNEMARPSNSTLVIESRDYPNSVWAGVDDKGKKSVFRKLPIVVD